MTAVTKAGIAQINELRQSIKNIIDSGEAPEASAPVDHYLANGLYGRRIYVAAGTTVITKVHLSQHITVALKGKCTVFAETGEKFVVTAPAVFVTEPGTYRAIYCHDDVEWLTVHHTELTDIPAIEHQLACEDYDEYECRTDYKQFLLEAGMTESIARQISENLDDQLLDYALDGVEVKPSTLQGNGVFALRDFAIGEEIGVARIDDKRTPIGRYTNHSPDPNSEGFLCDNCTIVKAIKPIKTDEEILCDYRKALALAHKLRMLS